MTTSRPSRPDVPSDLPFVGRRVELSELVAALARSGGPGTVRLIAADAGGGKTRLTEELAVRARSAGVTAVRGRCWDGGDAPPYWPWVQALRSLPDQPRTTDLAQLVLGGAAGHDRFELFDATAALLASVATTTPLLVVLEDLHDADLGSLLLARFVAQELHAMAVTLVGTYRPTDAEQRPEVRSHLTSLATAGALVELSGLGVDDVAALLPPGPDATEVHALTAGNPLHVLYLARAATGIASPAATADDVAGPGPGPSGGGPHGPDGESSIASGSEAAADRLWPALPGGLRAAVEASLVPIDEVTRQVLAAMAVLGPTTDPALVADLAATPVDEVVERQELGVRAGLLRTTPIGDELVFAHPLVRAALLDSVGLDGRRAWHRRAADLLGPDPAHVAEVATHLLAAGPGSERDAVQACRRAAAAATQALAHEEAVTHLEAALGVVGASGDVGGRDEAELLVDLGRARWRASRRVEADEAFAAANTIAIDLGDAELQAHAALGGGFQSDYSGDALVERTRRLTAALEALPPGDDAVRARLLAMLAVHRFGGSSGPDDAPGHLAAEAAAMAERLGDEVAVGYAKVALQVVHPGPATLARRLVECREVLDIARRTGDHGLALQGRFHLIGALLESADVRAIDVELAAQHRVVDQVAEPAYARHSLWFRCMRLIIDGRADDAELVATEGLAVAEAAADPDAFLVYGGQLAIIRWLQGRVLELEPLWADLRRDEPDNALWATTLAWLWATTGQLDAARGAVEAVGDVGALPDDRHWLLTATALAEAVAAIGDHDRAADLRERLLPYADRAVPVAMGIAFWGSVARPLGLLARTLGRTDEAIHHFETAIRVTARLAARPWLAQAQLDLAETLEAAGRDRARAIELVQEAASTVDALGVVALRGRVVDLAERTGSTAGAGHQVPASPDAPTGRPRISVLGTFEVVGVDGTVARWTSRKARVLLKVLVARRGAAVAREQLMDLLWPDEDPDTLANRLSVAVSTVRRTLDPARVAPPDRYLVSDRESVRLRLDAVDVDLEEFLRAANDGLVDWRRPERHRHALARLTDALALHRGEVIADEPYAEWAQAVRSETRGVTIAAAHALAALAEASGDELLAVGSFRRILEIDPFDETAHRGVIRILESLGAHGQAHQARQHYQITMADLGVG